MRLIPLICLTLFLIGCEGMGSKKNHPAESPHIVLNRAEALYKSRQLEQAANLYNQILQQDPSNVKALYRMGNISFRLSDLDAASVYYKRVIKIDPRHSRAQYNLAMSHLSLAEKHLKFYAATAQETSDMRLVSKIVGFLNDISSGDKPREGGSSVETIADQILDQ